MAAIFQVSVDELLGETGKKKRTSAAPTGRMRRLSITQKHVADDAIVLLTRQVKEKRAQAALAEIGEQPMTRQIGVVLRALS